MFIRVPVTLALLIGITVVGCQQAPEGADPAGSDAPSGAAPPAGSAGPGGGATPIAPAIEPSHPDAERTIELPESFDLPASIEPVAPAIEVEPPGPDPTIDVDPG